MSANCINKDRIQEYLDKTLPESEKRTVESHLAACSSCRKELENYRRLYLSADESLKSSLSQSFRQPSVDSVMRRLPVAVAKPATTTADFNFFAILLRFALPALAVVLVVFGYSYSGRQTVSSPDVDQVRQFSLVENSVLMVRGNLPAGLTDRLLPGEPYKLGRDDLMMVKVDQSRFEFSDAAEFSFKDLQVTLNSGEAAFELKGQHEGFSVVAQNVTVTPLGTSFKLLVRDWGTRITLTEGRLQLETITGQRRMIDRPSTLYVGTDGSFYDKVPQSPAVNGDSQQGGPPASNNRPAGQNNSPATLLDSF